MTGFCIVSSDADFGQLNIRLRQSGVSVYGFGENKASPHYIYTCTKFIHLENQNNILIKETPNKNTHTQSEQQKFGKYSEESLKNLLLNAYNGCSVNAQQKDWKLLSQLLSKIKELDPNFLIKNTGYGQLPKLLKAFSIFELDKMHRNVKLKK